MKIHSNASAIIANNALSNSDKKLSGSIEKLSSGYKINHAKDNPAGLAISRRMRAQIRGLENSSQNANDGISIVETAEGALSEIQDMIQRLNELAVKGNNGTMTDGDREAIESEAKSLKDEITRVAKDTQFNGSTLLDGTYDLKGYTSQPGLKVESYSDEARLGNYTIESMKIAKDINGNIDPAGTVFTLKTTGTGAGKEQYFPTSVMYSYEGDTITIKGDHSFELKLSAADLPSGTYPVPPATKIDVDLTGIGDMRVQIGANEGQVLELRIPTVSLKTIGLENTSFSTGEGCKDALERMPDALSAISTIRSRLGAYQNRLEHTASSLDITSENMTSAYSRIMDTDMSKEMTEYTKYQVLVQAGTSMLAQANERPSQVLQLLQ